VRTREPYNNRLVLHHASLQQRVPQEVVQFLIDSDPSTVKAKDNAGNLPFHYTCASASLQLATLLYSSYPECTQVRNGQGKLPLHLPFNGNMRRFSLLQNYGVTEEDYDSDMLELGKRLIEHYPAALSVHDDRRRIPLHYACQREAAVEMLRLLLKEYPQGLHAVDDDGFLPLHHLCSRRCQMAAIRLLLDTDPFTIICTTNQGRTPSQLYRASFGANGNILRYLTDRQTEAVLAIREAFDLVVNEQLNLPDLVVALIWSFARPNV